MLVLKFSKLLSGLFLILGPLCYCAEEMAPDALLNEFMAKKLEFFENLSKSPNLRSTNLKKSEGYLFKMLKSQQSIYSFLRINSKGVVANELIRQESEPEKKFRDISDQRGFSKIAETKEPYYTWIRNSGGRNYLLWMRPILSSSGSFIGGIAAKLDIWDLIHEFSQNTNVHFLVKIGKKSLYDHKWKDVKSFYQRDLEVPGIDNMVMLYEKPEEGGNLSDWESVPDTFPTLAEEKAEEPASKSREDSAELLAAVSEEKPAVPGKKRKWKVPVAIAVFGLLALILAIAFIKANNRKPTIL